MAVTSCSTDWEHSGAHTLLLEAHTEKILSAKIGAQILKGLVESLEDCGAVLDTVLKDLSNVSFRRTFKVTLSHAHLSHVLLCSLCFTDKSFDNKSINDNVFF